MHMHILAIIRIIVNLNFKYSDLLASTFCYNIILGQVLQIT